MTSRQPSALGSFAVVVLINVLACGGEHGTPGGGEPAGTSSPPTSQPMPSAGAPSETRLHLIDDMERDKPNLPVIPGNGAGFYWPAGPGTLGNWFVSDGSGNGLEDAPVVALSPARADSRHAIFVASRERSGRLDLWAQLDHPSNRPLDLSKFTGIAFWARMKGGDGRLTVALRDRLPGAGRTETPSLDQPLTPGVWQQFILPFDDFQRPTTPGEAAPAPLNRAAISDVHFVAGGVDQPIELWIDDLALFCRGTCP